MEVRKMRHQFLQIQFLCDKTREISEVINFHCTFSIHRFSRLILVHRYIP